MKSYLSLIPISAKTRRKQNRLTLICIVLSVFLVTSIFSVADIWMKMERDELLRKHGNYHVALHGIAETEAEQITGQDNVAVSAWRRVVNYDITNKDCRIGDKNLTIYAAEQSYIDEIRNYRTRGHYPQSGTEVMMSADAEESLGVRIGDPVVVQTPAGLFDYTVSGFCVDDEEYNALTDGVCAYMNADGWDRIRTEEWEDAETVYYIRFAKAGLRKSLADLKERYHLADGAVKENTAVLGMAGASSNGYMKGLYLFAAAAFLMILTAGVLMISSCMNSNISQRIQFFGMLRCIGASRSQIVRYVRLEALNWCKSAVPAGCLLGTAFTWILCLFLKNMVGGEFVDFSFRFSVIGVVFGAAVGVSTVLIAAHSPAKRAAGVSPVSAVSGNADTGRSIAHAANTRLFKVETALGVHHAAGTKKNLVMMTLSFAFTVILFFSFFAIFDFARALLPSLNSYTPDVAIAGADSNPNSIDRSLAEEIARIPGVEAVYGNAFAIGTPACVNGAEDRVDLLSYDDYMMNWSKKSKFVAGGDISKITEGSDYALTIFNRDSRLHVGDRIRIGGTELEIACVMSQGIWADAEAAVICSDETFRRIMGEDNLGVVNIKLTKDAAEETVNEIRALAGDSLFTDQRENNSQMVSTYWVFRTAAYGFLIIIALITALNIVNSISMSVSARIRQYGAMRAVGMSAGQLTKMITSEAAAYAVCGLFLGCAAGLYCHRLITVKIITAQFGGHWKMPLEQIAVIVLFVALSCVWAVYAPSKRIRDMAVTETINEL